MARHLIVTDRLAPLSMQSAAQSRLERLSQDSSAEIQLVHVGADAVRELQRLDARGVSCTALPAPRPGACSAGLRLSRIITAYSPDLIELFCESPMDWLNWLQFNWLHWSSRSEIRVHLMHRHPAIQFGLRATNWTGWFRKITHGLSRSRVRFVASTSIIAQDVLQSGIPRDCVEIEACRLPHELNVGDQQPLASVPAAPNVSVNRTSPSSAAALFFDSTGLDPSQTRLITTSAPLHPNTRLKELIWATELLHVIRDDVHLLVMGGEWQGRKYRNILQRFMDSSTNLDGHVHFFDWTPAAPQLIEASDVYCEASTWIPDSLPLQFARHRGIPTVIEQSVHNRRNYAHDQDCLQFESGQRCELARALRRLLDDRQLAARLAHQAQSNQGSHCSAAA